MNCATLASALPGRVNRRTRRPARNCRFALSLVSSRVSLVTSLALGALLVATNAGAEAMPGATPAPEGASLTIVSPTDGAKVKSPVTVVFGLSGMGVAPAGVDHANTGHHHLIIDAPLPDLRFAVPKDDKHRHFGGGQTQVSVELAPGKHTLQLLLGDHNHIPHDPPVYSGQITITVVE